MKTVMVIICALALWSVAGCDQQSADAPPPVRVGDTVCDQCNMIISDGRWVTSTIVQGPRGPEPRLFDDYNCQVNYENDHGNLEIIARWSRSHASEQWIKTEDAVFLISPQIRSPMGSQTMAFATKSEAEAAQSRNPGDILSFDGAWDRLGSSVPHKQSIGDTDSPPSGGASEESP